MITNQLPRCWKSPLIPVFTIVIVLSLVACSNSLPATVIPTIIPTAQEVIPTATPDDASTTLEPDQAATLSSLTKVDDYPLYTMHYHGSYDQYILPLQENGHNINNGFISPDRKSTMGMLIIRNPGRHQ